MTYCEIIFFPRVSIFAFFSTVLLSCRHRIDVSRAFKSSRALLLKGLFFLAVLEVESSLCPHSLFILYLTKVVE